MSNIKTEVKEHILTLKINLQESQGRSKSGKSTIIASSRGALMITDGDEEYYVNLNVYKK